MDSILENYTPECKWNPKYVPLIIYSWDDTLLPTTAITHMESKYPNKLLNINCLDSEDRKSMEALELAIIHVLDASLSHGKVIIMNYTNKEYIKSTCQRWFPDLWTFITDSRISLRSCDKFYEFHCSHASISNYKRMKYKPLMWEIKMRLMKEEGPLPGHFRTRTLKILFVGDLWRDLTTVDVLRRDFQLCPMRHCALTNKPTLPIVKLQLDTLNYNLHFLMNMNMQYPMEGPNVIRFDELVRSKE